MKRIKNTFAILTALLALMLLSTCDHTKDGQGETGTFTINLGGTNRAAFPPADAPGGDNLTPPFLAELRFEVIFTEVGSSTVRSFSFNGGQNATGRIAVGTYVVTMNIRFIDGNNLYARGIAEDNPISITSGSNIINMRVFNPDNAQPPSISAQPVSGSYTIADAVNLSVSALITDGGTLSYQWYSNTTNSNSGGTQLSGETGASFTPDIVTLGTGIYYYYVEVTNTNANVINNNIITETSQVAIISVAAAAVSMSTTDGATDATYANLQAALTAIGTTAGTYTIKIGTNQELAPYSFTGTNARNITLIADPPGNTVTVQLSSNGRLFTLPNNLTLTLDDGIVLRGRNATDNSANNNGALIQVNTGGHLIMMGTGSKITGNTSSSSSNSSGVYVNGGSFTMDGGEISGNGYQTSASGGGVHVSSGNFTLEKGVISGNSASRGGGVDITGVNVVFVMKGGEISGNGAYQGGMTGGGGGVMVRSGATFTMENGKISGNYSEGSGGGVYVSNTDSIFTMEAGEISGNTVTNVLRPGSGSQTTTVVGAGVMVNSGGSFIMKGGDISDNTVQGTNSTTNAGGGVYVASDTNFTKEPGGGTITGYGSDTINGNVVRNASGPVSNMGHAVRLGNFAAGNPRRDTTVTAAEELKWDGTDATGDWTY